MARDGILTSDEFFSTLRRRTSRNAGKVDTRILERAGCDLAVLMSDSSGFSRKTHEYGIFQFLSVMTRCFDRLIPILEKRGGECLSHVADNILAVFREPGDAVRAAVEMHRWLRRYNGGRPDAEQFNICVGIHYGPVVRLRETVYGGTVNVASKVGEDLAGKDEILVTREVVGRIPKTFRTSYDRSVTLGGKPFEIHRVAW